MENIFKNSSEVTGVYVTENVNGRGKEREKNLESFY